MAEVIRRRLLLAEQGDWSPLLREYLAARDARAASPAPTGTDTADTNRRTAAALAKVSAGCLRAGARILQGEELVTPTEHTLQQLRDLLPDTLPDEETPADLQAARAAGLEEADRVPPTRVGAVHRAVGRLRPGAAPGPSQLRNTHVRALAAVEGGAHALADLATVAARGQLPEGDMDLWQAALVAVLPKASGGVRPIALLESLWKLSEALLLAQHATALREWAGDDQLALFVLEPRSL